MNKSIITTVYKKDKQKILFSTQKRINFLEKIQLGNYNAFGPGCYLFDRLQNGGFPIIFNHIGSGSPGTESLATKEEREFLYKKHKEFVLGKT